MYLGRYLVMYLGRYLVMYLGRYLLKFSQGTFQGKVPWVQGTFKVPCISVCCHAPLHNQHQPATPTPDLGLCISVPSSHRGCYRSPIGAVSQPHRGLYWGLFILFSSGPVAVCINFIFTITHLTAPERQSKVAASPWGVSPEHPTSGCSLLLVASQRRGRLKRKVRLLLHGERKVDAVHGSHSRGLLPRHRGHPRPRNLVRGRGHHGPGGSGGRQRGEAVQLQLLPLQVFGALRACFARRISLEIFGGLVAELPRLAT
jgi:hypothetical protein